MPLRGRTLLAAALVAFGAAGPAQRAAAAPVFNKRTGLHEVPLAQLESAVAQGDRAEIARSAERIGPARLAAALRAGGARKTLLAALEAVPLIAGSLRLVDRVALLVESTRDPDVAERAAHVLGVVFATQSPAALDTWDVPPDTVSAACLALARVSADITVAVPLRLAALESFAEAQTFCAPLSSMSALFADGSAELRRAALLATSARGTSFGPEISGRVVDPVPWVAATAAAVLCARRRPLAASGAELGRGKQPLPAGYRQLVFADGVWIEDAIEVLPCLYRSSDPTDRRAFDEIRNGKPGPLRDRAREIAEQDRTRAGG